MCSSDLVHRRYGPIVGPFERWAPINALHDPFWAYEDGKTGGAVSRRPTGATPHAVSRAPTQQQPLAFFLDTFMDFFLADVAAVVIAEVTVWPPISASISSCVMLPPLASLAKTSGEMP